MKLLKFIGWFILVISSLAIAVRISDGLYYLLIQIWLVALFVWLWKLDSEDITL